MDRLSIVLVVFALTVFARLGMAGDYSQREEAKVFIDELVSEHQFDRAQLQKNFR